jgi:hypothetical protein
MNDFVNDNNRCVELPQGYKNLIDVLEAKKDSSPITSDLSLKNERVPARGLAHIEDYLRWFLCSKSRPLLSFFPARGQMAFTLMYGKDDPYMMFCFHGLDTACEKEVRGVLMVSGLSSISDAVVPNTNQRVLTFPLPTMLNDAVKIVTELLRTAYGVSDEAGLGFLYGD